MNKLLLLFLVIIGLVSGALIGMNSHELSKENLDKGDKAISVTNIIIGGILFFLGLGILFFSGKTTTRMIQASQTQSLQDTSTASGPIVGEPMRMTSKRVPTFERSKRSEPSESLIVPDELNLGSI